MTTRTKQRRALAKALKTDDSLRRATLQLMLCLEAYSGGCRTKLKRGNYSKAADLFLYALHEADHLKACVRDVLPDPEQKVIQAAEDMDWLQIRMHGGEPCFHLCADGRFCGRAKHWAGHDSHHKFVSLADLLKATTTPQIPGK